MSGPIILGVLLLIGVMLVKYRVQVKECLASTSVLVPESEGNGGNKIFKIVLVILGAIAALFLIAWMWPSSSQSLQSPSLATLWEGVRKYWLLIALILAGGLLFLSFAPKALEENAERVRVIIIVVTVALFIVLPFANAIWGEKAPSLQQNTQQGCTSTNPCTPTMGNGSTEKVRIPEGRSVCFEPYFWDNVQRLGYKTSYKGGAEGGTGVSADTFWFVPESGMTVPRYWFVKEGATQC